MRRWMCLGLVGIFFSGSVPIVSADDETLQFFQEEAKVVTASRRAQSIQEAPVAVDVITAEEIKASGAINLWDLFRFRPGMNVIDGHPANAANRAVVSVRGFAESFARNLQVLIDGRKTLSADS